MKLFFRKVNKSNGGFTLVETLVAISIFTVSILGMMAVLSGSISDTFFAKQKLTATYLAQEGIEYIRNMRDTYALYPATAGTGWASFINNLSDNSCDTTNGCFFNADNIDYEDDMRPIVDITLDDCLSSACPDGALYYEEGKYGFSRAPSGYVRKIGMNEISDDEIQITSTVSWKQGSGEYSVTFSENLFNWIQ